MRMNKIILALFVVLLFFGSLIVLVPNAAACHNKSVSCSPTEKDIVDPDTYTQTYDLDLTLTPGCGSTYWVGFTADAAPTGWSRKVYEKDDATKTDLLFASAPPSSGYTSWGGWISAGSGSVHFYAILEVKVTNSNLVENGDSATITVHCWSYDIVANELEDDPVTTTTTLNIPFGIRMKHSVPYDATLYAYPGNWAEFDIDVEDLGNASGPVDLSKHTISSPCLDDNWEWRIMQNPITLPENGTTNFTLKVKPPLDAEYGDFAMFIVKGASRADPEKYVHSVGAKTIVTIALPDISVKSSEMKCIETDICDCDNVNISIDVWNLGDIAVSNFELTFKLTDPGNEQDINTILITDTLNKNQKMNVRCEWTAIEGDHSICVHVDEKNLIQEKDEEGNNEAGLIVTVDPAKPKSIKLSGDINPNTCMPNTEFTVSGEAKYNKEYNYQPVTNANVQIKIIETNTIFNTKTDNKGKFSHKCTSPDKEGKYQIQISITKEGISAKKSDLFLTVSSFLVDGLVNPRTVITGDTFKVAGRVTENNDGVPNAMVTLEILDNDKVIITTTTVTDTNGFYTKDISAPSVSKYTEFDVKVTATKNEIIGSIETIVFVDIDTDEDSEANSVDEDDDNDGYPDSIELNFDTDPLDDSDAPKPVAMIGDDITVDEGTEISLSGADSYSLAGLKLTYTWDFGDESETESGQDVKYTYEDGVYTVTLTVMDEYFGSDSDTITVTVNDLSPTVTLEGQSTGEENTELTFKATATTPLDTISSYNWDFGDGSTDTGANVKHIFTTDGTFVVKVTVTDSDGSTAEQNINVVITPAPKGSVKKGDSGEAVADNTAVFAGVIVIIIIVVLLTLFMLLRRKKSTTSQPTDGRVASNVDAQASRRPTTQFADANIKPAMGSAIAQPRMAVPGTVPQRPAVGPSTQQQVSQLPPAPNNLQPTQQNSPQEQRDWNWDFNE